MTLPAFRPSELIRIARQIIRKTEMVMVADCSKDYSISALSKLVNDIVDLSNQIEAIALDNSDSINRGLKYFIVQFLKNLDREILDVCMNDEPVIVFLDTECGESYYTSVFSFVRSVHTHSTEIKDAILSLYLYKDEPKPPSDWFVSCDPAAPFRLHDYLRSASSAKSHPTEIKLRPHDDLTRYVNDLNAFMNHHPTKGFKFSGAGGILRVITRK